MSEVIYSDRDQRRVRGVVRDLIRARELLFDLAWKDLRVRYRYALLGFLWAVLEPVAMMLILTFVFALVLQGKIAMAGPWAGEPFAVVLLCGLIFWQFLAAALTAGVRSLLDSQNLIKKVHFPREVIPLAAIGTCLVNFAIGFVVLLGVHAVLGGRLGLGLIWFAPVFAIQFVLVVGLVLLLSCMNVYYRDVGYVVGVGIVFGFYATPIFYPLHLVQQLGVEHPWLVRLYMLNPMAGLIAAYREILFGLRFPDPSLLAWPAAAAVLCLVAGVVVFRRHAPLLADFL